MAYQEIVTRNKKAPCKILYTAKITTINKGKIVDISNLQPVELIHMDLDFTTSLQSGILPPCSQ